MKNSFLLLFITFVFSFILFSQDNIYLEIQKEYSYQSISGLDLNISPTDFLMIDSDQTFEYKVDFIQASGNWSLIKDTLVLNYITPFDSTRFFKILEFSKNHIILSEGDNRFELKHNFSNKINMFSRGIITSFSPIVANIGSVIFYYITKI